MSNGGARNLDQVLIDALHETVTLEERPLGDEGAGPENS